MMNNAKKLFNNTLLLTATAFIMRTVEVSYSVYLTNKIGVEGIGLFQLIMSVYAMTVVFSIAGIKLASMRLTADSFALGRKNQRQIMNKALLYGLTAGVIIALLLYAFSGIAAEKWIGDSRAARSFNILCVSLPFVSMSAALNGYFTSAGKILRYTLVQLLEQIFKITLTVTLLARIDAGSVEHACSAITAGISAGEIFSLSLSYSVFRFTSKNEKEKLRSPILKSILRISIPDALGASFRSVLTTLEHILIPKGLKKSGIDSSNAIAAYGIVHGMSLPVLLYPSAVLSSLSGLLVPEISALHISGQKIRIDYMIRRVLHLTLLFSIGTAGIIYFNSNLLSEVFYGSADAGFYMRLIAPLIPVMYCDMSVDGMLKGLDQQLSYMKYNIIDAASCVVLVYFLVPVMGVKGYIFVIYFSEILNFALSFHRLTTVANVEIDCGRDLIAPLMCVIASNLSVGCFDSAFSDPLNKKYRLAANIFVGAVIYVLFLRISDSVNKEETRWFKHLVKKD
ncbi:MAG: polysaccharide biosynthesis C-terminal domain-containing protein [Clostridia bacterium]|nr:polysaccharide biosynthesis C-terminal domain-containing protein [Clostridia bacterium]